MLRNLSYREISNYCNVSHTLISQIEKGERLITKEAHDEIVNGINLAYDAKCKGTLKAENTRKPKTEKPEETESETQVEIKSEEQVPTKKVATKIRKSTKTKKSEQKNENVCLESACGNQTDVVE